MTNPHILVNCPVSDENKSRWEETYVPHYIEEVEDRNALLAEIGNDIVAMITDGPRTIDVAFMDAVPNLKLIICLGVGVEKIDMAEAEKRGIIVTNGSGTNAPSVADHVFALMLAVARHVLPNDRTMRQHAADEECPKVTSGTIYGKKLGIIGLGAIGMEVAKRAQAFDMEVSYHNRSPRNDVEYGYCGSAEELAAGVQYLAVSCPGGDETRNMVNADVLKALGPNGVLINVSRGSVVDTPALITAVKTSGIWGAGLDVVGGDDATRQPLCDMDNVVMTPHLSGNTAEAWDLKNDLADEILTAYFSGYEIPNRVL